METELSRRIHTYLERLAPFGFSGAVLLERDGEVILHQGYGLADRQRGQPVTTASVFDIGSLTKQFTAAAILKLEEQGLLSVEDPISHHLPGVPPDKAQITIHQVLTHSAGLANFLNDEEYDTSYDYTVKTREAFLEEALATDLLWSPGERYRYSNLGYGLLGVVVELVSGQAYDRFLEEQLLHPAGLYQTGTVLPNWEKDALAVGYERGRRWGTALERAMAPDGPWWNLRAAGGILSTVADLNRWRLALQDDRVLSSASRQKLFARHVPTNPTATSHYGYGWEIVKTPRGTRDIQHNGSNGIFYADFHHYPEDDAALIFATNAFNDYSRAAIHVAMTALFEERTPPPPPVVSEPQGSLPLQACTGRYVLPSGDFFTVSAEGQGLLVTPEGQKAALLLVGAAEQDIDRLTSQHRQAEAIAAGLDRGDFDPLAQVTEPDRFQRFIPFLKEYWQPRLTGGASEVLGTMPAWWRGDSPDVSVVRSPQRDAFLEILWRDRETAGLGMGLSHEPAITFLPRSEHEFVGFHPGLSTPPTIRFEPAPDGPVPALSFPHGPNQSTRAVRRS